MNKTKIEWTNYTWSPLVGCKHNCWYCYAKRMNDRFKWIEKWTEPRFFLTRLADPVRVRKPSKIFVCSMADLFGDWVPTKFIVSVIQIIKQCPRHTFQFLTKNPKRYSEFIFPENCWLGMTIDKNRFSIENQLEHLKQKENYKFISFEPLLGDMSDLDLSGIDLVIVGAMTGPGAVKPKKEWIDSIKHKNIFYKNNIKKFL